MESSRKQPQKSESHRKQIDVKLRITAPPMAKQSTSHSAAAITAIAAAESLFQDDLVFLDEQEANDLSYWELVNPSDADSDTESLHSLENGFLSWYSLKPSSPPKSPIINQEIQTLEARQDQDLVVDVNFQDDHVKYCHESDYSRYQREAGPIIFSGVAYGLADADADELEEQEEDDEEVGDEDGFGLDDELVPWHVSAKLGRQRMRKLGKRVFAKMGNSKRNPFSYVKPGCVRGKHGLGIKA
ncbi:uncharacterized protein LOC110651659 [Hevea brasiliensis]|nr:uncharacterized protein LOC110651659 [Hevea brasiliensis]